MAHSRGKRICSVLVCAGSLYAGWASADTREDKLVAPIVVDLHELSQRLKPLDERYILERRDLPTQDDLLRENGT